jgi:hypothetical protein
MQTVARSILASWDTRVPAFVEVQSVPKCPFGSVRLGERADDFFSKARKLDLKLIPVVRITYGRRRTSVISRIIATDQRGVCFRLTREDLRRPDLRERLIALLEVLGVASEATDLVVDLHAVNDQGYDLMVLCALIPMLNEWRSFTVVGGAYPASLANCEYGPNWIPRFEWRSYVREVRRDLPRRPRYGDYGVRNPEPFDPDRHPTPSAIIRYALEDLWLVMKGKPLVPKNPQPDDPSPYIQFPAMAALIETMRDGTGKPCYKGAGFSTGDQYLHRMAEKFRNGQGHGKGNTGGSTEWMRAALNHHFTLTVVQIANLSVALDTPAHAPVAAEAGPLQPTEHTIGHVASPPDRGRRPAGRGQPVLPVARGAELPRKRPLTD